VIPSLRGTKQSRTIVIKQKRTHESGVLNCHATLIMTKDRLITTSGKQARAKGRRDERSNPIPSCGIRCQSRSIKFVVKLKYTVNKVFSHAGLRDSERLLLFSALQRLTGNKSV
jgi:hypothetical protein